MDKYLCERCGKELVFRCAYSKIDHKLICAECDGKEQPKELMKKITDLEAQLAESEKDSEEFKKLAGGLREELIENDCMYKKEINQLKQQLSEKENIIVEQKIKIRALSEENFLLKDDVQMAIKMQNKHDIEKKQTAIDELEKVKEWANNMYDGWKSNDGVNLDAKSGICNTLQAVCGMVNQQITSLKGER